MFNRPDTTQRVFAEIRNAKPPRLYVAGDGPRTGNSSDISLCGQTRAIIDQVDWECQVFTLFREKNLGCKKAVSSAIDWFFGQEEMGIILEDDCLPDPTFFTYCEVLLNRYATDKRIVHIGGFNLQNGIKRGAGDYYFSRLTHVWGWASWRRAWENYDVGIKKWEDFKQGGYFNALFPDAGISSHFLEMMEATYKGAINTWDYQLHFSNLVQGGLNIIPNVNLISNIGYGSDATHAKKSTDPLANTPVFPLHEFKAPEFFIPCHEADMYTMRDYLYSGHPLRRMKGGLRRIKNRLKL